MCNRRKTKMKPLGIRGSKVEGCLQKYWSNQSNHFKTEGVSFKWNLAVSFSAFYDFASAWNSYKTILGVEEVMLRDLYTKDRASPSANVRDWLASILTGWPAAIAAWKLAQRSDSTPCRETDTINAGN